LATVQEYKFPLPQFCVMKVAKYVSVVGNGDDIVTHTWSKCATIDILKTYLFIYLFIYVHRSVDHRYIFKYNQQDATLHNLFIYFIEMLYMFQAVPPPIIGSSKLCIQLRVLVKTLLLPATIMEELGLQLQQQ
jgi:hypothetical protein